MYTLKRWPAGLVALPLLAAGLPFAAMAQSDEGEAEAGRMIEEVVVTAQRREQNGRRAAVAGLPQIGQGRPLRRPLIPPAPRSRPGPAPPPAAAGARAAAAGRAAAADYRQRR